VNVEAPAPIVATMATRLRRRGGIAFRAAIALAAAVAAFVLIPSPAPARAEGGSADEVVITLFWGNGCPHCAAEKAFLDELLERHDRVVVDAYEVWYDTENQALFEAMATEHGIEVSGVPTTFIGGRSWVGYSEAIGAEIEAAVVDELAALASVAPSAAEATPKPSGTARVPLFGEIDAAAGSLVTVTAAIALVDGFNPCSLWVLSVLLAMMLHSGSRRRLLAVGATFLVVAGAAYGLFMLGLFAVMDWVGYTTWVQVGVAAVVGIFGLVAVKDYFWYGRGPSLSIPEDRVPEIARRSRELALSERSLVLLVPMTALLAAGVSLLELPCTAGFPVMWNGILADRGVTGIEFGALLGLYLAIYLLDELVLFAAAFATLRATRIQERHGRTLKLLAGTVMLALAVVMLGAPDLLDSVAGALAVFGAALGAAALVLVIAPRLGMVAPESSDASHPGRSRRQRVKRAVR
jgi:glutaredoxin